MNTTQATAYQKITFTLPDTVVIALQEIPKGQRSPYVAEALLNKIKLDRLKQFVEKIKKRGIPSTIKEHRGGWRKRVSLHA